jgi:hypothetical protein
VTDLRYSDGIAAARTMVALEASASALQRRLPTGWELSHMPGMTYVEGRSEAQTCSFRSTRCTRSEATTATPPARSR